jgi:hypothetical protein
VEVLVYVSIVQAITLEIHGSLPRSATTIERVAFQKKNRFQKRTWHFMPTNAPGTWTHWCFGLERVSVKGFIGC